MFLPCAVLIRRQRFESVRQLKLQSSFRLKIAIYDLIFSHNFEVQAKFDANNLAYTSHFLPLHVDLPFYDYVPGVGNPVN